MLKLPRKELIVRVPVKSMQPTLFRGVGEVIVSYARLELYLTQLVYDLLRIDYPLGRQILRGDNTREVFEIAVRLFGVWKQLSPVEDLNDLRKALNKARDKRNDIAHGAWMRTKGTDIRLRVIKKSPRMTPVGLLDYRIMPGLEKRTLSTLRADARYIHRVTARVRRLQKQVQTELKAWKLISPSRQPDLRHGRT